MQVRIDISELAEKQIRKLPKNIAESLYAWVAQVDYLGLLEVRKIKGYHDEPLKGDRKGQRSIRLNKSYRAIYTENKKVINLITIIEVTKHKY